MRFRSHNPVYRNILNNRANYATDYEVATYAGVTRKTLFFVAMILVGAFGGLYLLNSNPNIFNTLIIPLIISTFIFALVSFIAPTLSKVFGTLYCLAQGMIVGVVSLAFETLAPGVVLTALLSTVVVLVVVTTLFLTNIVKVTQKFIRFLLIFAISMIISTILIRIIMASSGTAYNPGMSLLISGVMIFLATLYIFFDLEYIRQIVEGRAPSNLEWYVSFGLVFTIVWLYMEILPVVARILLSRR